MKRIPMRERWRAIEDFECYEVSDLGRVRRAVAGTHNTYAGRILKPALTGGKHPRSRYLFVAMWYKGKLHSKTIHTLVAKAFIPNPLGLPEVNHKGEKTDNRATMLEWRSVQGNALDTMLRGLHGDGLTYMPDRSKWVARYQWMGKSVYVGAYAVKQDARAAYRAAIESIPYIL